VKLYHGLKKISPLASAVDYFIENRAERIHTTIEPFLKKKDKILDIGSGTGHTAQKLIDLNYKKVNCVDYSDMNTCRDTKPKLYDGKKLPYKKNEFDTAMLITVLHHTPDPELIVKEACRVAKKLIIMEDTYNNIFQKYATYVMDSIGNMQFKDHPHTNKTDKEWLKLFKKNGLKLLKKKKGKFLWFFESTTYWVEGR
jgi:ubiquinone/menaquinone biosynthesis C-methylase UbiE